MRWEAKRLDKTKALSMHARKGQVSSLAAHLPVFAAGFGTLLGRCLEHPHRLPRFHRAGPSTALDKRYTRKLSGPILYVAVKIVKFFGSP